MTVSSSLVVISATTLLQGYYYCSDVNENESGNNNDNNDNRKGYCTKKERKQHQNNMYDECQAEKFRNLTIVTDVFSMKDNNSQMNKNRISQQRISTIIPNSFLSSLFYGRQQRMARRRSSLQNTTNSNFQRTINEYDNNDHSNHDVEEDYNDETIVVVIEVATKKNAINSNFGVHFTLDEIPATKTAVKNRIQPAEIFQNGHRDMISVVNNDYNNTVDTSASPNDHVDIHLSSHSNTKQTATTTFNENVNTNTTGNNNNCHQLSSSSSSSNEDMCSKSMMTMMNEDEWLGGEKNMFPIDVEYQAVRDIFDQLTNHEQQIVIKSDKTIPIRHYRAEKGCITKAVIQIKAMLQWRQEFGVDELKQCWGPFDLASCDDNISELRSIVDVENATGKIYVRGYDKEGRALMYMTPAYTNTNHEMNNMKHLVWNFEKAIECTKRKSYEMTGKKLDKINLVIDYDGFQMKHTPPLSTTKYTLDILQKYYPERMYHAYLLNPPLLFRGFWNCIKMFVDPVTKEKIIFCTGKDTIQPLLNNVSDHQQLEYRSGGPKNSIAFNSKQYQQLPIHISYAEVYK